MLVELVEDFDPETVAPRQFTIDFENEIVELLVKLPVEILVLLLHVPRHIHPGLIQFDNRVDCALLGLLQLVINGFELGLVGVPDLGGKALEIAELRVHLVDASVRVH